MNEFLILVQLQVRTIKGTHYHQPNFNQTLYQIEKTAAHANTKYDYIRLA